MAVSVDAEGDGAHEFVAECAYALQVFRVGEEACFYKDCCGFGLAQDGEAGEVEVMVRAGLHFVGAAGHYGAEACGDFFGQRLAAGAVGIGAVRMVGAVVADVGSAGGWVGAGVAMEGDCQVVVTGVDCVDGFVEVAGVGFSSEVDDIDLVAVNRVAFEDAFEYGGIVGRFFVFVCAVGDGAGAGCVADVNSNAVSLGIDY